MIDYFEALKEMNTGKVVKYVGTVNGNVWSDNGASFCMCRGCIFLFDAGEIKWNKLGYMVYDPDFRYELTGETVDPRAWKPEKNIKKSPRNAQELSLKFSLWPKN